MISASAADFRGREREYLMDCIDRGWITQGNYVREFEKRYAEMCQVEHAIACSSGTAALHLAMLALGIGPGNEVVVPALTYVATANAVTYCGARPVFCDIDPVDWCISPASAQAACANQATATVITVDMYDALASREFRRPSVVDAAHAPGAARWSRHATIETHSFYASKVIACGEGGMVTTDDDELARVARLYRGQGAIVPGRYYHDVVGYNYRMTDLQAAVGLAQLECLEENLAIRRRVIDRYRHNLGGYKLVTMQGGERAAGWAMAVLLPPCANRSRVAAAMLEGGVETRPFFDPLPSLPPHRGDVPTVAASVAWRGLVLPTHTKMTDADVDASCEALCLAIEDEVLAA